MLFERTPAVFKRSTVRPIPVTRPQTHDSQPKKEESFTTFSSIGSSPVSKQSTRSVSVGETYTKEKAPGFPSTTDTAPSIFPQVEASVSEEPEGLTAELDGLTRTSSIAATSHLSKVSLVHSTTDKEPSTSIAMEVSDTEGATVSAGGLTKSLITHSATDKKISTLSAAEESAKERSDPLVTQNITDTELPDLFSQMEIAASDVSTGSPVSATRLYTSEMPATSVIPEASDTKSTGRDVSLGFNNKVTTPAQEYMTEWEKDSETGEASQEAKTDLGLNSTGITPTQEGITKWEKDSETGEVSQEVKTNPDLNNKITTPAQEYMTGREKDSETGEASQETKTDLGLNNTVITPTQEGITKWEKDSETGEVSQEVKTNLDLNNKVTTPVQEVITERMQSSEEGEVAQEAKTNHKLIAGIVSGGVGGVGVGGGIGARIYYLKNIKIGANRFFEPGTIFDALTSSLSKVKDKSQYKIVGTGGLKGFEFEPYPGNNNLVYRIKSCTATGTLQDHRPVVGFVSESLSVQRRWTA